MYSASSYQDIKDPSDLEDEEETDGAEKHPLVKDKRFLSLSYFPNVIPDCFKEVD